MKSPKKELCSIPGCNREVKYKQSQLCGRCYHWMYYWQQKSPTDVMRRLNQLEFWEKRMKVLLPANVRKVKVG